MRTLRKRGERLVENIGKVVVYEILDDLEFADREADAISDRKIGAFTLRLGKFFGAQCVFLQAHDRVNLPYHAARPSYCLEKDLGFFFREQVVGALRFRVGGYRQL